MDQPIQPLVSASTYKVRDDVEAAISCASSLDRAVFMAFTPGSRADELLDHLTVNTMNFARKADGTTPLMAACASGNKPLAELLLDLGCHALMKDDRGWTAVEHAAASPVQQDLGKLILERVHPPLDGDGKPVHAWDTCDHPPHCRFLDESLGWLICTNCALVLDEKALVMAGEPAGGSKNPWAVKAADAEYNAWRHDEMELSDAMHRLGDEARLRARAGKEVAPMPVIPPYPAEITSMTEIMSGSSGDRASQRRHPRKLLNPEPLVQQRFKGAVCARESDGAADAEEDEEEDLMDPRAMADALGDPYAVVAKWRRALRRWAALCQAAVRQARIQSGQLPARGQVVVHAETCAVGLQGERVGADRGEMEIEYEVECV